MSISDITFGNPVYDPVFTPSVGDEGVIRLRSKETAPLSHESLDENFTNLGNKINEILALDIDKLVVDANGKLGLQNINLTASDGINLSATGVFTHQLRPDPDVGYSTANLTATSRKFVSGLSFDTLGHVTGYTADTLNFTGSGSVSVDTSLNNQITISSSAYTSGSSPTFADITASSQLILNDTSGETTTLRVGRPQGGSAKILFPYRTGTSGTEILNDGNSGNLQIQNASGKIVLDNNGNVGIGTTHPDYSLQVGETNVSHANDIAALFVGSTPAVGDRAGIQIGTDLQSGTSRIYSYATATNNADLAFEVKDDSVLSEKMRITSSGNIGIGTTDPDGFRLLVDNGIGNYGLKVVAGNNGNAAESVFEAWNWQVNGSDPKQLFKIDGVGDVELPAGQLIISGSGGSPTNSLDLSYNGQSGVGKIQADSSGGNTILTFATSEFGTLSEQMRIKSDGYVGIGTTSPSSKLTVAGDIDITGEYKINGVSIGGGAGNSLIGSLNVTGDAGDDVIAEFKTTGTGSADYSEIHILNDNDDRTVLGSIGSNYAAVDWANSSYLYNTGAGRNFWLKSQNDLGFFAGGTTIASNQRMTIKADGDVGIGTTSPTHNLHITGKSGNTGYCGLRLEGTSNTSSSPDRFSTTDWVLYASNTGVGGTDFFGIYNNGNNVKGYKLVVNDSGNVGIGTTSPDYPLDVIGTLRVSEAQTWLRSSGTSATLYVDKTGANDVTAIFAGGKVGIGTVSPSALLTAVGNGPTAGQAQFCQISANSSSSHAGIAINSAPTNMQSHVRFQHAGVNAWQIRSPRQIDTNLHIYSFEVGRDTHKFRPDGFEINQRTGFLSNNDCGAPPLMINYGDGSFYKHLGHVTQAPAGVAYNMSNNYWIHVRIRDVWNSGAMAHWRVRGYLPYGNIMDCSVGMYRYNHSTYRNNPHSPMYMNQGTQASHNGGIYTVYNTNADPGYLVLVVYWPTSYTGFTVETYSAGNSYGALVNENVEIIDAKRTNLVTPQW